MSDEETTQSCCVVFCTNTNTNSNMQFYEFPDDKLHPEQRGKWLKAIRTVNGSWWQAGRRSVVCAEHFVSGAPAHTAAHIDYAPSRFPEDSISPRSNVTENSKAPHSASRQQRRGASYTAAAHVLGSLMEHAAAERSLCSSRLYRRVKSALRISVNLGTLHAAWVGAQVAALLQVREAAKRGDRAGAEPPPFAARLADLVLLYTDVDAYRLLSPASEWCDEEYDALKTLIWLMRCHDNGKNGSKQCWSRVYAGYRATGRTASVIVLQRRWHELKLQAREWGVGRVGAALVSGGPGDALVGPGAALVSGGPGDALVGPGDALVGPGAALVSGGPGDALVGPGDALVGPGDALVGPGAALVSGGPGDALVGPGDALVGPGAALVSGGPGDALVGPGDAVVGPGAALALGGPGDVLGLGGPLAALVSGGPGTALGAGAPGAALYRAVLSLRPHLLQREPRAWRRLVLDDVVLRHPLPVPPDLATPAPPPDDWLLADLVPSGPPPADLVPNELPSVYPVLDHLLAVETKPKAHLCDDNMISNTTSALLATAAKVEPTLPSLPSDGVKLEPQEEAGLEGEDLWQSQSGAGEKIYSNTLQLLQSLDPSQMHAEIYYDSDDDDCASHGLDDKVEVKAELARSVRDFIQFEEEEESAAAAEGEASRDVDPKLLMDVRVMLERLPMVGPAARSSSNSKAGSQPAPAVRYSSRLTARSNALPAAVPNISPATRSSSRCTAGSNRSPAARSRSRHTAGSNPSPTSGSNSSPAAGTNTSSAARSRSRHTAGSNPSPTSGSNSSPAAGTNTSPAAKSSSRATAKSNPSPKSASKYSPAAGSNSSPVARSSSRRKAGSKPLPAVWSKHLPVAGIKTSPAAESKTSPAVGSKPLPVAGINPSPAAESNASPDAGSSPLPVAGINTSPAAESKNSPAVGSKPLPVAGINPSTAAESKTSLAAGSRPLPVAGINPSPAAESINAPAAGYNTSPAAGCSSRCTGGSNASPAAESATSPAAESATSPAAESATSPAAESATSPAAESATSLAAESATSPAAASNPLDVAGINPSPAAASNISPAAGSSSLSATGSSSQRTPRGWRPVQLPDSARDAGGGRDAPTAAVRPLRVSAQADSRPEPVETAAPAIKRRRSEAASLVSPASTGPLSSTSRASSASSLSADVEAEHRSAARRRLFQLYASFAALLPPIATITPNNNPPRIPANKAMTVHGKRKATDTQRATDTTPVSKKSTIESKHATLDNASSAPANDKMKNILKTRALGDSKSTSVAGKYKQIKIESTRESGRCTRANISHNSTSTKYTKARSRRKLATYEGTPASSRASGNVDTTRALSTNTPVSDLVTKGNTESAPMFSNSVSVKSSTDARLIASKITIGISVMGSKAEDAPAPLPPTNAPASSTETAAPKPKSKNSTRKTITPRGTSSLKPLKVTSGPSVNVTQLAGYDEWQRQKTANAKYFHINTPTPSKKRAMSTAPVKASTQAKTQSLDETSLLIGAPLQDGAPLPSGDPLPTGDSLLTGNPLPSAVPLPGCPSLSVTPLLAGQPLVLVVQSTINNVYAPASRNTLRDGDCIELSDSD